MAKSEKKPTAAPATKSEAKKQLRCHQMGPVKAAGNSDKVLVLGLLGLEPGFH